MSLLFLLSSILAIEGYPVILDITTTSDWTELHLENVSFHYQGDTVLLGRNEEFRYGLLSIQKKDLDTSRTRVQFFLFLPKDLPPFLEFFGKKGNLGQTNVTLLSEDKEVIAHFTYQEESKEFSLSKDSFRNLSLQSFSLPKKTLQFPPLVLAFYCLWYGDNWFDQGKKRVAHQPLLGFYSSQDHAVLKRHILWAKEAKLDGFIISWWGKDSPFDQNLKIFLPICESLDFKFTLYLETTEVLEEDLQYLETTYARSPAFLKINGRPVIFIFVRVIQEISLPKLREIKSPFDFIIYGYAPSHLSGFLGFHEYYPWYNNLAEAKKRYLLAGEIARIKNKLYAAPVIPGYDDRNYRQPGKLTDRGKGDFYKENWEAVLTSDPDWILITSFNEWFEGTEIEPSREFGDFYLKLTAHYAKLFKKRK
ncbi:MAG: hypothetical protein ABIK99_04065 [candidate division WOR-3 bacterium]